MRLLITLFAFLLSATLYGQNDYSMSFDGVDDYVEIPSSNDYDNLVDYLTISAWVKIESITNPYGATIIARREFVGSINGLGERTHFHLYINNDLGIQFGSTNNTNLPLYGTGESTSNNTINLNEWTHIAVTFNNGELRFYKNGIQIHYSNYGYREMFPNNHWVNIGRVRRSNNITFFSEFDGEIDNVCINDFALNQQQIQNYMSCPPTGNEEGLLGCWNFDEGEGDTVYDLSDNGNNGEVIGSTWSTDTPEQSCVGCIDPVACNYNPYAIEDDGSCDYTCCPGPGCCDVGTVWDIESQTCIVLYPSDSNFDGCVDLNDLMDLLSAYGVCAVSGFTTCGDLLGYQGYDYQTVQIGEQCWFAENLQAELYQSGDQIPLISSTDMVDGPTPVYKCIYDDDIMNRDQMGYLYSWYTTIQETQVCPNGWKVPSLEDFNFLFDEIGGLNQAGNHLKSEPPIWNGADTYGFSGLPSGYYNHPYTSTSDVFGYYFLDQICYLWTSTYSGETTPYYIMFRSGNNHAEIFSSAGNYAEDAMSIRCIKD